MLNELTIENFAIIDRLHVRFGPGFTVLTGETGAGKSIVIDALQAALGARTSGEVVRTDTRQAAIEAVFEISGATVASLGDVLGEYGIELDDTLILRREINPSGRGTARLNGRAIPLSALQAVGELLVDIHGQSDHLSVLRRDRQLDAIDHFGGLLAERRAVSDDLRNYGRLARELDAMTEGQREAEQRLDLLRFQVQEIEGAALRREEEEELAVERRLLANAERLAQLAGAIYGALEGESSAVLDAVRSVLPAVSDLAQIDAGQGPVADRLAAVSYELEDIAQEMRHYRDAVEYDPERLADIETRLDLLNRLRRKYGATIEDVIAFSENARRELTEVETLDDRIADTQRRLTEAEERAAAGALALSQRRHEAADVLTGQMREALQGLGLRNAEFAVEIAQTESPGGLALPDGRRCAYTSTGIDTVTFLVSFNPGEPLRPLDKVASGGETSRFLLALKSVLAGADHTPTLVFDEVDVGVGARSGLVVAERLRALARDHQVLSITHLPQIAALADRHLTVAKLVTGDRTSVGVRELEREERIGEIAEMMSGSGSEVARRSAEELLADADRRARTPG